MAAPSRAPSAPASGHLENRREGNEETKEVTAMLKQWAVDAGLPAKPLYKVTEISKATGIAASTLYGEITAREGSRHGCR